jgi:hypothetical protein
MDLCRLTRNCFWFFSFKEIPSILDSQISIDAFHTKPFRRFYESPWRIENWVLGSWISFISGLAVLREMLQRVSIHRRDSTNLREWLTTNSAVLWKWLTATVILWFSENVLQQHKRVFIYENHGFSCQFCSEILWISKKFWYKKHQNLK